MSESAVPVPFSLFDKIKTAAVGSPPHELVTLKLPAGDEVAVKVSALTGAALKAYLDDGKGGKEATDPGNAKLVVASCSDPATGSPLFAAEHAEFIVAAPWLFRPIVSAAFRLNKFADEGKAG